MTEKRKRNSVPMRAELKLALIAKQLEGIDDENLTTAERAIKEILGSKVQVTAAEAQRNSEKILKA
jgi:hypothetical protein